MMRANMKLVTKLFILLVVLPTIGYTNDPDPDTPWPVAFSDTLGMHVSHTLMNSYGDMNGAWEASLFHAGIDIDATTGEPDCNEVRCMDDGYVTSVDSFYISGTDSLHQWQVIICDELGGAVQHGWAYGHLTRPDTSISPDKAVIEGQLIGYMNENVDPVHLHFQWTDWNSYEFSYCNPLKYLNPAPLLSEGYTWEFNPEGHDPQFQYFFLPQIFYGDWGDLSVEEVNELMLDPSDLSEHVDFFFARPFPKRVS